MIQLILQGILKIGQHEPHKKSGSEFRCSWGVSCSFSISDDHPVILSLSGGQVMNSNKSRRTKIKRTKNRTIQTRTDTSSGTRSIASMSIAIARSSGTLHVQSQLSFIRSNRIFDVIVSMLAPGETKDNEIGICCFSDKHAPLRRKSKDGFARNQDNVSEWGDISIYWLLFQWTGTIKFQLSVLV